MDVVNVPISKIDISATVLSDGITSVTHWNASWKPHAIDCSQNDAVSYPKSVSFIRADSATDCVSSSAAERAPRSGSEWGLGGPRETRTPLTSNKDFESWYVVWSDVGNRRETHKPLHLVAKT